MSLSSAISLAHALIADLAASLDVDVLVIKGIGSQLQELQRRRTPSDIDVLVRPADFEDFGRALAGRGWEARPADADTLVFPRHSTSFFHRSWPCDIDVHFRFPGFEADAEKVFASLWSRRERFELAGRWVARPSREASLLILALHYLRSIWVERHRVEYAELLPRARTISPEQLLALARELGALACLRPFMIAAFGEITSDWGTPSPEWELRTRIPSPNARRVATFLRASARDRVTLARIALFPDRETLQKGDIHRPLTGPGLLAAYARRWSRGARAILRLARRARVDLAGGVNPPNGEILR